MAFVSTLATEASVTENPTWDDVEKAICALDARTITLVMLAPATPNGPPVGEQHMGIGGGKDDRCVVYVTKDNLEFWNLVDPQNEEKPRRVPMMIGGQEGDYAPAQCVPRALALLAAREYFSSGRRATGLDWVHDGPTPAVPVTSGSDE